MGSVAEADEPEDEGAEKAEEGEKGIEEGEAGLVEVVGLLDEKRGLRKPDRSRLSSWEEAGGHCEVGIVFSPTLFHITYLLSHVRASLLPFDPHRALRVDAEAVCVEGEEREVESEGGGGRGIEGGRGEWEGRAAGGTRGVGEASAGIPMKIHKEVNGMTQRHEHPREGRAGD